MDTLVASLGITSLSKSQVSETAGWVKALQHSMHD
jgi:hypothetical protein